MKLQQNFLLNSKYILPLTMLYITLNIACTVVAYRFYHFGNLLIAGSGIIYPLTFFISDSVAEVYGYSIFLASQHTCYMPWRIVDDVYMCFFSILWLQRYG